MKGVGNQQDYGERIYDPRIGRFLSVDPLMGTYPWLSSYQFAGNNPILNIDLEGLEPLDSRIRFTKDAKPAVLSQTSKDVINLAVKNIDAHTFHITSTGRTPIEQANVMYKNLAAGKSSTYKAAGESVKAVYYKMKDAGASPEEIKAAMLKQIMKVGPSNVSAHSQNPRVRNAIDFGINNLTNDLGPEKMAEFKQALEDLQKSGKVARFLNPDNNHGEAAFHLEIINNDSPEQKAALPDGSSSATPASIQLVPIPIIPLNNLRPTTLKVDNLKVVPNIKHQTQ